MIVLQVAANTVALAGSRGMGNLFFEKGEFEIMLKFEMADLEPGEYVYVRVVQENYGMAWSSPIWVVEPAADGG